MEHYSYSPYISERELDVLQMAANQSRGVVLDAVAAASSGHLGMPLGAAEIGAALFGKLLRFNPLEPRWINRDRFILSAGHGSLFLYFWLHLSGFGISMGDIKKFRKVGSLTPGHPEFGLTPGVECTTGPLGQGIANAVGFAMSSKMLASRFSDKLFDSKVVCLCGDGCLQEGVSHEACSLAGHLGLNNLILIYDSNGTTIDGSLGVSQSDDVVLRFEALGFDVQKIDGNDINQIILAYERAKDNASDRPRLIIAKTIIGKGVKEIENLNIAHGEFGARYVKDAKKDLGLGSDEFWLSEEVRGFFKNRTVSLAASYDSWLEEYNHWRAKNPALAEELEAMISGQGISPTELFSAVPEFSTDRIATRDASCVVIQQLAQLDRSFLAGSADLFSSCKNKIADAEAFSSTSYSGRNIYFGIREHAMGAIMNGIAYDGIFRPSGSTFLVFSDYMRPSIRLAAMAGLPVLYIFTHDSIQVGEDGPTHQPVESITALRCIKNLDVIRPADAEETVGAWAAAINRKIGPTALILTRQCVNVLSSLSLRQRRVDLINGGYIAKKEISALRLIFIATGSELKLALDAAEEIGDFVRVVSMPCCEAFDRQSDEYKELILPNCEHMIALEAGISLNWYRYIGRNGKIVSVDEYGFSAGAEELTEHFGLTVTKIVALANKLLNL
ncbi:MAG: transketolase [Puniceicoccales bacterium]|jgi:transketolase|nr:transketolase [Puniceicoccales bacterium]